MLNKVFQFTTDIIGIKNKKMSFLKFERIKLENGVIERLQKLFLLNREGKMLMFLYYFLDNFTVNKSYLCHFLLKLTVQGNNSTGICSTWEFIPPHVGICSTF